MSGKEFRNLFDVYYNNICSNQAPGLNDYEVSVLLTKGQDEILKNYFNPKGNKYQEGYDDSAKRQIDFSMLTKVYTVVNGYTYIEDTSTKDGNNNSTYIRQRQSSVSSQSPIYMYTQAYTQQGYAIPDHYVINDVAQDVFKAPLFDNRDNSRSASFPEDIMFSIHERVVAMRDNKHTNLMVVPINFEEYNRLMAKPYKHPLKYQAWRLINTSVSGREADLIVGPNDTIEEYTVRYVRKPKPVLVAPINNLGLSIEGHDGHWTSSEDYDTAYEYNDSHTEILNPCELDSMLHEEVIQRAVELAKVAWQGDVNASMQAGQRSE